MALRAQIVANTVVVGRDLNTPLSPIVAHPEKISTKKLQSYSTH
jgi:hypothetical protein